MASPGSTVQQCVSLMGPPHRPRPRPSNSRVAVGAMSRGLEGAGSVLTSGDLSNLDVDTAPGRSRSLPSNRGGVNTHHPIGLGEDGVRFGSGG